MALVNCQAFVALAFIAPLVSDVDTMLQGRSILAYNKVVEICQKFGVAVVQFAIRSHKDTV